MLPKALKSCPNSNKSPNLVTLKQRHARGWVELYCLTFFALFYYGSVKVYKIMVQYLKHQNTKKILNPQDNIRATNVIS